MLASLLFPYDEDAGECITGWLEELENEDCIRLYEVNGSQYLQIVGWAKHQRIDKPSKPQFPEPSDKAREDYRESRERSCEEGKGRERKGKEKKPLDHRADDRARLDQEFEDRFWPAYPRKVGKANAMKAFLKIGPDVETVTRMLGALRVQTQSDQWRRDNGQFIPHPATWLNGRRWEDEAAESVNGSAPDGSFGFGTGEVL
jgi:hypothetical protein